MQQHKTSYATTVDIHRGRLVKKKTNLPNLMHFKNFMFEDEAYGMAICDEARVSFTTLVEVHQLLLHVE